MSDAGQLDQPDLIHRLTVGRMARELLNDYLASHQGERAMAAHAAFDPLWKSGQHKRGHLYGWLAKQLGIEKNACHIGMFDAAMCRRVVEVCRTTEPEVRT